MLTSADPKPLRWQRARYSPVSRKVDIVLSAAQLVFYLWWDSRIPGQSARYRNRRAQWFVGTLLDLGPTFIKLGQALSTRADLLPLEYVQALGRLQDKVPAFDPNQAIALVEAELGASIYHLYREFEPVPIAAASLGQVHRARLHTGEVVVVKVQRPGLDKLFQMDFKILRQMLRFCDRLFPWTRRYNLQEIYLEFAQILQSEIDYIQEAMNADRFRYNFKDHPRILVPQIYPKHTTRRVLTMDYLPGIKLTDRQSLEACGINVKEMNQLGICCYLKQLLQDGFFQADPHPGNMAVSQDGCLIFYDFGMMAEVLPINKDQMVKTFFAVLRKDTDQVVDTLTDMGLIEPLADMTPVRRVTQFLLEKFTEKPVELQAFGEMRSELYALYEQQPFRLPAKMTFVLKALTTLDGVARSLDPQYNLLACAKPFVKSLTLANGQGRAMGELARQAKDYVMYRMRQPSAAEILMQQFNDRLEQRETEFRNQALENSRKIEELRLTLKSLVYFSITGFTLLVGAMLLLGTYTNWAIAAFVVSGLGALALTRSLAILAFRNQIKRIV
ncbi:MAG: AarF/ABC1/UbiB kinase family protein [Leptolyngbyaceae cyanobacterium bins.302]|nr:AarF/ABC1/UbiB kinase family protein [Leptolyngbyaceae cyanobacterium bins.302]